MVDPEDQMPVDWLPDVDPLVDDPDAQRPSDWNDAVDGMWIPRKVSTCWVLMALINPSGGHARQLLTHLLYAFSFYSPPSANPRCVNNGCGPWSPRLIKNPAHRGKWRPPQIRNPAHKGEWRPRLIPNPDHFLDLHPHNLAPMVLSILNTLIPSISLA
jgi:calnexin